jgi:hypothetical protein
MGNINDAMGEVFDPATQQPAMGFDPIPTGWYPMQVEAAELKETKAKTGTLIDLEVTILDKHPGRKIFKNINLVNPSAKAQEIGRQQLAALVLACGLIALKDTDELLGKQVMGHVIIKKDAGFEPKNDINAFKSMDGTVPAKTAATTAPQSVAQQKAAPQVNRLPWKK